MELKNYQEDIVLDAIHIALEDRPDILHDQRAVTDIAAYVLNRLPPRYITSERGFIRLASEQLENDPGSRHMVNVVTVLVLINQAVEYIETRRPVRQQAEAKRRAELEPDDVAPIHNFPQIIGQVRDAGNGKSLYGAVVALYIDDALAETADPGWPNPVMTSAQTRGYFSFWPRPMRNQAEVWQSQIRLEVELEGYEPATVERAVTTCCDFEVRTTIDRNEIENIGIVRLTPLS